MASPIDWLLSLFRRNTRVVDLLEHHFGNLQPEKINISQREFPFRVRADLQRAMDQITSTASGVRVNRFCGVDQEHVYEPLTFSSLLLGGWNSRAATAPQYEEIDVGEDQPVRCLKGGLWLLEKGTDRYAVLLTKNLDMFNRTAGISFQVATFNTPAGGRLSEGFFRALELAVNECRCYRGKILSLEQEHAYTGKSSGIKVHRLQTIEREQVILPAKTLSLLDRNIIQFSANREKLRQSGQATRKGILFYGPPGTGKSHTIHYLARALKGQTLLLITAEQVGLLGEYMALARLLQPSIVVIEDIDLIARERTEMRSACEEATLNKLLNEMDGLRETADILFILTTNRPEELERALASRPGRVDQAIEFPLPDDDGRDKLIRLYAGDVQLAGDLVKAIVHRTQNVSAAFIKELMRRAVQFKIERDGDSALTLADIENALDEMLFSGGTLNVKLLGGNLSAAVPPPERTTKAARKRSSK